MDSNKINLFYETKEYKVQNKSDIRTWLEGSANQENKKIEQLNIIFCDDSYLLRINIEYLNHNSYTDIITFDNSDNEDVISGDIFISVERALENSKKYNQELAQEINRLMIHGLLHLIGYSDKLKNEKLTMTKKEDYYLNILN